ncbi:UDP-glucose:2-hydroxyflavanone C-glucosyltransferase-like [Phoenix dactylifera]|uniref:Glycosyltransferase n=1 Tax=Phoenix dactylifera TaxID=42345 RepID=A0A8B9AHY7_PHODC|nr:UDP-glucose:2-hydroxyflavanone C-glucosyltransferase-like [Phoenix dactylifera]
MPPPEMRTSGDPRRGAPHIALLPSAGMGHLTPFCRLAVGLSDSGCDVSFITVQPTVSSAESRRVAALLAAFPRLRPLDFRLADFDPSAFASTDPFFLRFEAIRRSAHLLPALLAAASPPVSAVVVDISLVSTFLPVLAGVGLPCYLLFTASAAMLSLCAHFPAYIAAKTTAGVGDVEIPGLRTVPKSSIPLPLHDPNNLFTTQFVENGRILQKACGILINTFHALEQEALDALNGGKVVPAGLPPVVAIGPLKPVIGCERGSPLPWLDAQPARSVVYVSFGSRTAMSAEQMKELGTGLERSGCRFLWVVKSKVVDREEEVELEELLGEEYLERVRERGLVVKGWVEQEEILGHVAVGGFLSHCGWNSVTEAALHGVPILAWPRLGDQRVNADVMARGGLGIWVKEWSWEGEEKVVRGEEIGERVRELMEDEGLRASAARLGKEAVKAVAVDGSSGKGLAEFIGKL